MAVDIKGKKEKVLKVLGFKTLWYEEEVGDFYLFMRTTPPGSKVFSEIQIGAGFNISPNLFVKGVLTSEQSNALVKTGECVIETIE